VLHGDVSGLVHDYATDPGGSLAEDTKSLLSAAPGVQTWGSFAGVAVGNGVKGLATWAGT